MQFLYLFNIFSLIIISLLRNAIKNFVLHFQCKWRKFLGERMTRSVWVLTRACHNTVLRRCPLSSPTLREAPSTREVRIDIKPDLPDFSGESTRIRERESGFLSTRYFLASYFLPFRSQNLSPLVCPSVLLLRNFFFLRI